MAIVTCPRCSTQFRSLVNDRGIGACPSCDELVGLTKEEAEDIYLDAIERGEQRVSRLLQLPASGTRYQGIRGLLPFVSPHDRLIDLCPAEERHEGIDGSPKHTSGTLLLTLEVLWFINALGEASSIRKLPLDNVVQHRRKETRRFGIFPVTELQLDIALPDQSREVVFTYMTGRDAGRSLDWWLRLFDFARRV